MLGAIAGDMAGSSFEFRPWQGDWREIPLLAPRSQFTDDTVLTIAVADAIMKSGKDEELALFNMRKCIQGLAREYPCAGYGNRFAHWIFSPAAEPCNSLGNGSAMRVSPVGWAYDSLEEVEKFSRISAQVTHNHPEGIKGACAVAGAIFLARNGADKEALRSYVSGRWGYDLSRPLEEIRQNYGFDETCPGSVPEAVTAFLESDSYESALQKAIWLRGDADTQADIAGAIAEAFYGSIPPKIKEQTLNLLDDRLYHKYMEWTEWLENK